MLTSCALLELEVFHILAGSLGDLGQLQPCRKSKVSDNS